MTERKKERIEEGERTNEKRGKKGKRDLALPASVTSTSAVDIA